ncbi:MAG TPA: glycosyltransferase family A protein [Longimicrobium sp.]
MEKEGPRPPLLVVIPTRNRAALAGRALGSVLASAGVDLAVLVSDNSTDARELARLEALAAAAGDPRVRYVRPPRPLSMTEHWAWALEEGLAWARPERVSFLTDRMLFRSGGLRAAADAAREHPGLVLSYNHTRVVDYRRPVIVEHERWTGSVFRLSPARLLEMVARGAPHPALPRMLNCLVPVGVLERVRRRFGSVFSSVAPDINFCFRCLAVEDEIAYLDRSLLVHYALARSNGTSMNRGLRTRDHADFIRHLPTDVCAAAPIPEVHTAGNVLMHEYNVVRAEAGGGGFPPIEMPGYLRMLAAEVALIEDREARRAGEAVLRAHGWRPAAAEIGPLTLPRLARAGVRRLVRWMPGELAEPVVHGLSRALGGRVAPGRVRFGFLTSRGAVAHAVRTEPPRQAEAPEVLQPALRRAGPEAAGLRTA